MHRAAGAWQAAFTLVELLVVVAVVALLISILLPALGHARMQAKMVRTHADLRQVCMAIDMYSMDNRDTPPPARVGCTVGIECQLPVELARGHYLPPPPVDSVVPQAHFPDLFNPAQSYKYTAPGPLWYNGVFYDEPENPFKPRMRVWVPSDFPYNRDPGMTWADNTYALLPDEDPACPVKYAVWSVGPNPQSEKFPRVPGFDVIDESRLPLPRAYWLTGPGDTGLITHYVDRDGHAYQSP